MKGLLFIHVCLRLFWSNRILKKHFMFFVEVGGVYFDESTNLSILYLNCGPYSIFSSTNFLVDMKKRLKFQNRNKTAQFAASIKAIEIIALMRRYLLKYDEMMFPLNF